MRWRNRAAAGTGALLALLLTSCAGGGGRVARVSDAGVKIGSPYTVRGRTYVPRDDRHYDKTGYASWYGGQHRGRLTANGERFDPDGISAAHPTLPLPSYVEVTALDTGRTILVRINDRGPFADGRIIDLSHGAAEQLGIVRLGVARVRVRRVEPTERQKEALRGGRAVPPREDAPEQRLTASVPQALAPPPPQPAYIAPAPVGVEEGAYVQVAALSDRARADQLAASLGDLGTGIVVPAGTLYRVRIGPIAAADLASALAQARARGYQDARIVRDLAP